MLSVHSVSKRWGSSSNKAIKWVYIKRQERCCSFCGLTSPQPCATTTWALQKPWYALWKHTHGKKITTSLCKNCRRFLFIFCSSSLLKTTLLHVLYFPLDSDSRKYLVSFKTLLKQTTVGLWGVTFACFTTVSFQWHVLSRNNGDQSWCLMIDNNMFLHSRSLALNTKECVWCRSRKETCCNAIYVSGLCSGRRVCCAEVNQRSDSPLSAGVGL